MAEPAAGQRLRIRAAEIHPEADAEMRAAARYYEQRRGGLGDEFLDDIERAGAIAAERPASGTPIGEGFRWVLARRFRYAVIYREAHDGIEVIAVAHLRRRPGYWRTRA